MAGNDGNLTIDEIMALGDTHTNAMKPKKKKKVKSKVKPKTVGPTDTPKVGLAGSNAILDSYNDRNKKKGIVQGGLKTIFGAAF